MVWVFVAKSGDTVALPVINSQDSEDSFRFADDVTGDLEGKLTI